MDRAAEANQPPESINELVDTRIKELLGGLHARMADQDLAIAELERRVKALEEALRLLTRGVDTR